MRNHIITALIYITLLPVLGGCRKFIQAPIPSNSIITSQAFSDSASATASLSGIYIILWNYESTTIADGGVEQSACTSADELAPTSSSQYPQEIYHNSITTLNTYMQGLWTSAYQSIYQANACIAGCTASATLPVTVKNRVIGEARFMRAFLHFYLVNLFGAVPLVTSTDYNVTAVEPRTSVDSVYGQIFTDLHIADSLLSMDQAPLNYLRPNRYTVAALLARVSLYRARWADAETYATRVLGGNYTLLNNPDSVFLNGSHEAIWQLAASYAGYETAMGTMYVPYAPSGLLPSFTVDSQLIAAFETGDRRFTHWLAPTVVGTNTYYYPYKYKLHYDGSATPKEAYVMFRLAEQFLIRAEAKAEQGNDPGGAIADLNTIRARAGLAPTTAVTQTDVLAAIQHERQTELCFEWGHRWLDLKRTGAINAVLGAPGNAKPGWTPTAALYPIPYNETQLNPFLIQNPGYN